MTLHEARSRAAICRTAIGKMLYGFRVLKANPLNWPSQIGLEMSESLRANRARLESLYRQYPGIKPTRAKQLSLF